MSAEKIVEEAKDVAEQVLDVVEDAEPVQVFRNNPAVIATVAALGLVVGAGAGYLVARKVLRTEYDKIMQEELEKTREYYAIMNKRDQYETPERAALARLPEDTLAALKEYRGQSLKEDEAAAAEVVIEEQNIFVNNQPVDAAEWDYEVEQASRNENEPYIINHEEYLEAEPGYEQVVFTYYEGDDVLADEQDKPVDEIERVVGEDNLMRFGHGSGQNNVVYIRNDRLTMDFEIVKSTGKFAEEVLGFIEHSDKPRSRRARWGDDE